MDMAFATVLLTAALAAQAACQALQPHSSPSSINSTKCNGKEYVYEELAGYGFVGPNEVDKFGDNLGGLGSAIHIDQSSWKKTSNGSYTGVLWSLPDRGWWVLLATRASKLE